jgi:hypothetical protein
VTLLLFHRPIVGDRDRASTVMEHVHAFQRHSRLPVVGVNTAMGMPQELPGMRFAAIVFHYTIFNYSGYFLDRELLHYLDVAGKQSFKIALFQDEYHYCGQRFAFLNRFDVDCVYTMLTPEAIPAVYGRYTEVPTVLSSLPGYVSEEMLDAARRFGKPENERTIDVGYRGRRLPAYAGRGGREKYEIGVRFAAAAQGYGLRLDISCEESDRIYGTAWYRFLADCKAVLGVESGVDYVDVDDELLTEYLELSARDEEVSLEQLEDGALSRIEGRIPYRTISPRHFEAAALRVCQILFPGQYSGLMQPMVHYIPLKKDFSNVSEVVRLARDPELRARITDNAHRDLIASGAYSYGAFMRGFDRIVANAGVSAELSTARLREVERLLRRGRFRQNLSVLAPHVARRLAAPVARATRPLRVAWRMRTTHDSSA